MTTIVPHHLNLLPENSRATDISITVQDPPQAIYQLPTGAIIVARVLINSKDRLPKLDTIFGQLIVKTLLKLPENSILELQVSRSHPQFKLLLTKIDGKKIDLPSLSIITYAPVSAKNQSESKLQENTQYSNRPTQNTVQLDIGARIKATLLRPAVTSSDDENGPINKKIFNKLEQTLTTNSTQTLFSLETEKRNENLIKQKANINLAPKTLEDLFRVLKSINDTIHEKASTTMRKSADRIALMLKPSSHINKDKDLSFPALLQAGSKLVLKFHGISKSPTGTSQNGNINPNFIHGVVMATTKSKQPILKTPLGMIALDTKVPLLTGENLALEILPKLTQRTKIESPVMRFEHIFQFKEWPNLDEAIHQLNIAAPGTVRNFQESTLPQPNAKLTSNMLFFLNALKVGNIQSWMGNTTTSLLNRINPELLSRLDEDFYHISRAMIEPPANEWRTALVPFLTTMGLEQFQLHTQSHPNNKNSSSASDTSRFIVDLTLSRLGRFQLDGFVWKKRKQIDLIVRSQKALPRKMRIDITRIYTNFSEISKIGGQVTFQANQNFVEIPMPNMADHASQSKMI